ncbi:MAG: hypothetical protein RL238_2805 [Actinomycetota bacterium]|jgi:hypothetical protein
MALTVLLRTASGKVLGSLTEDAAQLMRLLPPTGDPDFPYLGLLDPYGDTYFSSFQMQAILPEIRRLKELSTGRSDILDALEELAEQCRDGVHVYLIFVGD